jgi:hypothetical protein
MFFNVQGDDEKMPTIGDDLYVHFNATIASLDTGEVIDNGTLIGGKMFDSSEHGGQPRIFTLGSDSSNKVDPSSHPPFFSPASYPDALLLQGLELGLASMRRGERAALLIRSDYAYGAAGRRFAAGAAEIPPGATLRYEIDLVRINEVRRPRPPAHAHANAHAAAAAVVHLPVPVHHARPHPNARKVLASRPGNEAASVTSATRPWLRSRSFVAASLSATCRPRVLHLKTDFPPHSLRRRRRRRRRSWTCTATGGC